MNLLIDVLLVVLGSRCFARGHSLAFDAIRDPLLLIVLPLACFAADAGLRRHIVFVVVDRAAYIILLLVHVLLLFRSQRAAVRVSIRAHFMIDVRFAGFHVLLVDGPKMQGGIV